MYNPQGKESNHIESIDQKLELRRRVSSYDGVDGLCKALDVRLVETGHGDSTVCCEGMVGDENEERNGR